MAGDELERLYLATRAQTVRLAAPISRADHALQRMADASPTQWHLAHTTWFFERMVLAEADAGYAPVDPAYDYWFNSYYDAVGPRHPRPERHAIPVTLDAIHAYRAAVDARLVEALPRLPHALRDRVVLGVAHEEQHQELLLTDIFYGLLDDGGRAYRARAASASPAAAAPLDWLAHPGGLVELGVTAAAPFAFDNEGPRHRVWLEPFALATRCVTNAEWDEFVADGGYADPRHWLSDGWATAQAGGWRRPWHWLDDGREVTLNGVVARAPAAPVCHLSFYEADAYARWAGARLPTEAEWEVLAAPVEAAHPGALPGHFVDDDVLHPAPQPPGFRPFGDVWQWTASPYTAYPRFAPAAGALGEYNGKFMCNQLVLRGGSCLSPRRHLRASYRNFFPPHARWQMSGLRLARWT